MISLWLTSCKKNVTGSDPYNGVPRKEVPEPFVGTFVYVTQSGGYIDQIGTTTVGVAQGVTLQIHQDGTGNSLYTAESGSFTGAVTTDEVYSSCTFEITKTGDNTANMIIHTVSGKDYHNHVYLHDLDASKVYPNRDIVWNNVTFGTDAQGTVYFTVGEGTDAATFTRQ